MTDNTQRITSQGLGFFTASGLLKNKEQLKTEETSPSQKSTDSVSTDFTTQVNDALTGAEGRFVAKANSVISQVQIRKSDIEAASDLVNREISTAKALKSALKNGNSDEASKQQQALIDLQSERQQLADTIDNNNRAYAGEKTQILSLDGQDKNRAVTVSDVQFSARGDVKPAALNTPQDVTAFIDSLKVDKEALKSQSQEFDSTKALVQDAIQVAREQLDTIRQESITNFSDASNVANAIAQAIKDGGVSLIENTIKQNLTSDVLGKLLN